MSKHTPGPTATQRVLTAGLIARIKAAQVVAGTREAPTADQAKRDRAALAQARGES